MATRPVPGLAVSHNMGDVEVDITPQSEALRDGARGSDCLRVRLVADHARSFDKLLPPAL